jgi:glycosyltransferase involved in cell wall biosynthesis
VPRGYRAIVVDNGSVDGSGEVARGAGATVIAEHARGFGAAVAAGVDAATAPIVAICDADASLDPAELPRLVGLLDRADLVLGRRVPTHRSAWPMHARAANGWLSGRISRVAGVRVTDLGPMRVARTEALRGLELRDRRSGYPLEMVLRAAAAGWRIAEIDVPYAPRVGRSKVTGTVRGTATAVYDMGRILRDARA